MVKWEYLNVTVKTGLFSGGPSMVTNELDKYGEDGWELVNFQFIEETGLMCFIFKRPKED